MKASRFLLGGIFCFLFFCNVAKGIELPTPPSISINENMTLSELFEYIEKEVKQSINQVIKMALPYTMEYIEKINVSSECRREGLHVLNGLRNLKSWAVEFLDSSGKIPDGLLVGSLLTAGAYDECLGIDVKSTKKQDKGKTLFVGQYCLLESRIKSINVKKPPGHRMFTFPEELKEVMESDTVVGYLAKYIYYMNMGGPRMAVCVPSGCKKEDIDSVINIFIEDTPLNVTTVSCEVRKENEYTVTVILVMALYSVIIFLVLGSALLDYYSVCKKITYKSKAVRCFLAFSLYSNFRKLYEVRPSATNVQCLNGIKFLGMTWVILSHTAVAILTPITHGFLKVKGYTEELSYQVIVNSTFEVDTFFFIGSFLVSYLSIKLCKVDGKRFNAWMYIIHRLLRIYPAYLMSITLTAVLPLMGSGPLWNETTGKIIKFCQDNWWASIFFINNIYKPTEPCWTHTWYITVDMQLYLLAIVFIVPLIKWPKVGIMVVFLGIIASVLWSGLATYINDYPPTMLFGLMDLDESLNYFYHFNNSPLTHLGPYALGILVGYIFAVYPNCKMSRMTLILGWSSAFICSVSVLYGSIGWYQGEMPYYLLILYASFCRIAWQLGIAWMLFACITGYGGFINTILSWKIFVPLGRLTYCAYLLHLLVLTVYYGNIKTRLQPDIHVHIWLFLGHVIASYGLGLILYMFVEVPFWNLERILLLEKVKAVENTQREKNIVVEGIKTSEKNGDIVIITPSNK